MSDVWKFLKDTVDYFDIQDQFLASTGWSIEKYEAIVQGTWPPSLYEDEIPRIVRGLGQSSRALGFWKSKWENWKMSLLDNPTVSSDPVREFQDLSIPDGLKKAFPPGRFLFVRNRLTKETSYSFILDGDDSVLELGYPKTLDGLLVELQGVADYMMMNGDPRGKTLMEEILQARSNV